MLNRRHFFSGPNRLYKMSSRVFYVVLTVFLLLLVGCTGSIGNYPPRLLIVGLIENSTPQLALIEDTFLTSNAIPNRIRFIENSRRTIAEPAISFDVVERNGDRSELLVLSRSSDDPYQSYFDFFNLSGIDPSSPSAFTATRTRIDLSALVGVAGFCPTEAGISRDGQSAIVFSDRTFCSGDDFRAIYFLDLETETVVDTIDSEPIFGAGIYIDQDLGKAYFLLDEISTSLYCVDLDGKNRALISDGLGLSDPIDLGQAGQTFVVLQDDSFQTIDFSTSPPTLNSPVVTPSNSSLLIESPRNLVPEILFLTGSNLLAYHDESTASGETFASTALNGIIEPELGFAYLILETGLQIFDLISFDSSLNSIIKNYSIHEVTIPGPISWTKGLLLGAMR
jgi:hypothetical protein